VYEVDLGGALGDEQAVIAGALEARLGEDQIIAAVRASPAGGLAVLVSDPARRAGAVRLIQAEYGDRLEHRTCEPGEGPSAICVRVSPSYLGAARDAALKEAVATIRARLDRQADTTVVPLDDKIVVELPAADPAAVRSTRRLIARTGALELRVVDNASAYMQRVFLHVGHEGRDGTPTDERARRDGIRADVETWRSDGGGPMQADYYLVASDRDVLRRYLDDLARARRELAIPADREIGYERVAPVGGPAPYWRTYLLERTVALSGAAVANATASFDPNTGQPVVLLDFDREGTRKLADVTSRIVGRKLAMVFEGRIQSAPVVNSAIHAGRASIAMSASDPAEQQQEQAQDLVRVLRAGSLRVPLREVSPAPARRE
jgi:preprotein translocase subunit SecD